MNKTVIKKIHEQTLVENKWLDFSGYDKKVEV